MQLEIEKTKPRAPSPPGTPNPEPQGPHDLTARMHFYSVHNAGEQLRHNVRTRTGKKPDRMVGR
jgi:hypothetical protein